MKRIILIIILITFQSTFAEVNLKGKILGNSSQAMKASGILFYKIGAENDKIFIPSKNDGSFDLNLENESLYKIALIGAYHESFEFKLLTTNEDKSYQLVINLAPFTLDSKPEPIIIGNFNNFDFHDNYISMNNIGNGNFLAKVPVINDTLKYQIAGVLEGNKSRSVNGTQSDFLVFDGESDFESVLVSNQKFINLTFNSNEIPKLQKEISITTISPELFAQIKVFDELNEITRTWRNQYISSLMKKDENSADSIKSLAFQNFVSIINKQKVSEAKLIAELEYLENINSVYTQQTKKMVNKDILIHLFNSISPASSIWIPYGYSIYTGLDASYEKPTESLFFKNLIKNNSSDELKIKLLFDGMRFTHEIGDKINGENLQNIIISKFPESDLTKQAIRDFSPFKRIQIGKILPDFKLMDLEDTTQILTLDDFRGKFLLIDFWASWCGPCIMEIPTLQGVYEDYKNLGFEILSISLDRDIKEPLKFKSGRLVMPWKTSWSRGEFKSPAAELFEVNNIPKPILVNPNGEIIALDEDLRGEYLLETLKEIFKN